MVGLSILKASEARLWSVKNSILMVLMVSMIAIIGWWSSNQSEQKIFKEFGKRLAGDNPRIHSDPCDALSDYSGDNGQYVTQSKRRAV